MKQRKGEFGYIRRQKRVRFIRTLILFAIAFAVFLAGYILNHGDRRNIYTVIAVVGVIPAAMACVSTIMMWLRKPMDASLYREICEASGELPMQYELFLTTREKNLYLDAALVTADQVIGYTHEDKSAADIRFFEEHIEKTLRASGYKRSVKIFDGKKQFLSRIAMLSERAPEKGDTDDLVRTALLAMAL